MSKQKTRSKDEFQFQQFSVKQDQCTMKVGTDGVLLGAWAPVPSAGYVLDIGTGTGLISLMVAQRQPDAQVVAVEIDEAAAQQARENMEGSPFADRLQVSCSSIQEFARKSDQTFDLIVSNPPFFSGGVISEQEGRASVRHTVKLSHQDLLRSVQRLLSPDGSFCLVLPWLEGLRFQEIAATYQLRTHRIAKVCPNPDKAPNRVLLELKKSPAAAAEPETEQIIIYDRAGDDAPYSEVYRGLTDTFYLS
ncbi:MAG: tRNA1(Val) (adenine(37)-N6)-methyltransferase [Bacteroidota bacterium]